MERRIRRLLIANRGEIVSRVARTARAMGIEPVGVFAEPDRGLPYVRELDAAVELRGTTPGETYLDRARILEAARRLGADAVHPGYGFLSENAEFARQVEEAGLAWVGPPPGVIAQMGDKVAALAAMEAAGVPVLPRTLLDGEDAGGLAAQAAVVGFPLMVKAAAGGGGRGMRIVTDPAELEAAVAAARREAIGAFGDGRLFAEPYVIDARHIEVQVLADNHGNVAVLFERECSIQRRHQKIVEEAPSPAVSAEARERLIAAAIVAARAIGYRNAGTIEFLWRGDGRFSFMEMNTRLQVEHPVTELITGVDLVREQLRIAQGLPLSIRQEELRMSGHAIEVRLYAEDPAAGFLPQAGRVRLFSAPEAPWLRVDAGIASGSEISPYFDPMVAKVVAHGQTRDEAAARLAAALDRLTVFGPPTNRDFLRAVLRHPKFLEGETTTRFLETHAIAPGGPPDEVLAQAAALAALTGMWLRRRAARVQATIPPGWRNNPSQDQRTDFTAGERPLEVRYAPRRDGSWRVAVGQGVPREVRGFEVAGDMVTAELDGLRVTARWHHEGMSWWLHLGEHQVELTERPRLPERGGRESIAGGLTAPMPGKVVAVTVEPGQHVEAGDVVAILEAMKMEHRLFAGAAGTVREVRVEPGAQVALGDVIAVIDEEGATA
ncbi:biotin carboxylase N-terminal domain-containing protein [Tepidiforma thermophila]|uniref:biotin carboxylase n=1 Tax=Tepidiforma thermophila (strain KCTC 52669 / CGMCC 1.13589 / G233) TaxID=2761530 RepID=A0A2A9HIA5_TEPT2|nr:biotin carboxylase N-terminal domain-containing protein [Tepidiforma thermophila]PFG74901.1 propionyl-CoA carboxylase alpha chain [Tepidiforma thermophila]